MIDSESMDSCTRKNENENASGGWKRTGKRRGARDGSRMQMTRMRGSSRGLELDVWKARITHAKVN